MSDSSDYDDREWDSAHCCSCCCDCCACHKISHAFWWVLFFTFALFATGVGVFLDGIFKQSRCSNSLNQDDPASVHSYDDCRQQAYVQLLASIALGGAFIILVFVSCCAFMDILCFRRWRSRPHMRPNAPTPRTARKQPTPRGTAVQYDTVAGGNDTMERQGQRQQQHHQYPQQQQTPHSQQQQQFVAMQPMYSLKPAPKSVVMPQPSPSAPQSHHAPPSMQLQHPSLQVTPPLSSPLPAAPTNRSTTAAPTSLSPMPTLGEQMRAAAAAASVAPSASNPPSADVSQLGGALAPPIPTRPAAPSAETR